MRYNLIRHLKIRAEIMRIFQLEFCRAAKRIQAMPASQNLP